MWAVGSTDDGNVVEHYDGNGWSVVASPQPGAGSTLESVDARSPTDAWAVGTKRGFGAQASTFTLHWDGTAWTEVASPNPRNTGDARNAPISVVAISKNDAWAVGTYENDETSFRLGPHVDPALERLRVEHRRQPDAWGDGSAHGRRVRVVARAEHDVTAGLLCRLLLELREEHLRRSLHAAADTRSALSTHGEGFFGSLLHLRAPGRMTRMSHATGGKAQFSLVSRCFDSLVSVSTPPNGPTFSLPPGYAWRENGGL